MSAAQFIVMFDDDQGTGWPMGPDAGCQGALCASYSDGAVSVFSSRADARHAIRISAAWAKLQQALGNPYNSDFVEAIRYVRIVPLVAWGLKP